MLDEIREPIWSKIIEYCGTFAQKGNDAQFTEIFEGNLFQTLSKEEKQFFEPGYTVRGVCTSCGLEQEKKAAIVGFVHETIFPDLKTNKRDWPKYVETFFEPDTVTDINCTMCNVNCPKQFQSVNFSRYLLLDFGHSFLTSFNTFEQISIKNNSYKLRALVQSKGAHFACALFIDNLWIYIDDLYPEKRIYKDLDKMFSCEKNGWFFVVYQKFDPDASDVDFTVGHQSENVTNILSDESKKEYPSRKRNTISYENLCNSGNKKRKIDTFTMTSSKKTYDPLKRKERHRQTYDSEKRKSKYDPEKRKAQYQREKQKRQANLQCKKENSNSEKPKKSAIPKNEKKGTIILKKKYTILKNEKKGMIQKSEKKVMIL